MPVPQHDQPVLSVRGEATLEVAPDFAVLAVAVSGRDPDRRLVLAAVQEVADEVRAAVAGAAGVRRSALSGLQVSEQRRWDEATGQEVLQGWQATVSGTVDVDAAFAGPLAAAAVDAGAQLTWMHWRLEPANPAYRTVRRMAVEDARRAGADFADALAGSLGRLLELADPGLLDSGSDASRFGAASVPAPRHLAQSAGDVDLDPQPVTLHARVEARYLLADR